MSVADWCWNGHFSETLDVLDAWKILSKKMLFQCSEKDNRKREHLLHLWVLFSITFIKKKPSALLAVKFNSPYHWKNITISNWQKGSENMILEILEIICCIGFQRTLVQDRMKWDSHNPVGDAWVSNFNSLK